MALITIDAVEDPRRRSKGWFLRLCEAYEVEQLGRANTELPKLYHIHATPWTSEEDTGDRWRSRRAPFADTGWRHGR
jgi:hypothetical protein